MLVRRVSLVCDLPLCHCSVRLTLPSPVSDGARGKISGGSYPCGVDGTLSALILSSRTSIIIQEAPPFFPHGCVWYTEAFSGHKKRRILFSGWRGQSNHWEIILTCRRSQKSSFSSKEETHPRHSNSDSVIWALHRLEPSLRALSPLRDRALFPSARLHGSIPLTRHRDWETSLPQDLTCSHSQA